PYFTQVFGPSSGAIDYSSAAIKPAFDAWFWTQRAAVLLKKWKLTLEEFKRIVALTDGAQLLDFATLPLDDTGAIASLDRCLRTSRLIKLRDTLPEPGITFLEVLEKLSTGVYAAEADPVGAFA